MDDQHFTDGQESVIAAMRRQIAITPMPDPPIARFRERMASCPRLVVGGAARWSQPLRQPSSQWR
ncbi:MAG TPA: hypothetical protein VHV75_06295 [Solirubrobacteraceae bacterium]|jgi:hypothetical protein|nr:hypothetical protein [Solirubrobacteraceae bacterium]